MTIQFVNSNKFTLVDDDIAKELDDVSLYLNGNGAVQFNYKSKTIILSRFVLNYDGDEQVDHIDVNPLNNQRDNLRVISSSDNNARKIRYIGRGGYQCVKKKRSGRYCCNVKYKDTMMPSKTYDSPFQAAVDAQNWFEMLRPNIQVNLVFPYDRWGPL